MADEIVVIDHGKVIAAGTAQQLKNRIGGEVLDFTVPDRTRLTDAAAAVAGLGPHDPQLMPGIIGQTAAFASFATAIALARQSQLGVIDRFRAMPMARGAVLGGRLCADAVRMMITILVIVAVGCAVGFRFQNGLVPAIGMVLLAEAFGLAVCCISGAIGLAIQDEESVQAFGLIWLFPLTFVSSAFVPVRSMPGALRAFANHQPVTFVIDAMRSLALGGPLEPHLWQAIVSIVVMFAIFGPLAVRVYKRRD